MSSCLHYITTVDYCQFNSYIDVIYTDPDVNVLMMLIKWYITRYSSAFTEKNKSMFLLYSISAYNVILQSQLRMIFLAN
jgi:hypothetical protein